MSDFSESRLRDLGIENAVLGRAAAIRVTNDPIGRGLKMTDEPPATLEGLDAGGEFEFLATNLPPADRVAFQVRTCSRNPWMLQVCDTRGRAVAVLGSGTHPQIRWLRRDVEDPATVYLQLETDQTVKVDSKDGQGLVVMRTIEGFVVADLHPPALQVEGFAEVRAPLEDWARTTGDDWLRRELVTRAMIDDSWEHAVGAGLHARFSRDETVDPAERASRLLAGRLDSELLHARRWARGWTEFQKTTIEDLAIAAVDRLARRFDELSSEHFPRESWWQEDLLAACIERDDLEGIRVLLRETGAGVSLEVALGVVDVRGSAIVAGLPIVLRISDERLARSVLAPGAWWAELARD